MTPLLLLLIALAGGAGAWCRFTLDGLIRRRWRSPVPVGTLVINLTGSFALGLLTGVLATHAGPSDLRSILGTGFLGGYTTFSTAAVELATLSRDGRAWRAAGLGVAQVLGGLAAAALGLALGGLL